MDIVKRLRETADMQPVIMTRPMQLSREAKICIEAADTIVALRSALSEAAIWVDWDRMKLCPTEIDDLLKEHSDGGY